MVFEHQKCIGNNISGHYIKTISQKQRWLNLKRWSHQSGVLKEEPHIFCGRLWFIFSNSCYENVVQGTLPVPGIRKFCFLDCLASTPHLKVHNCFHLGACFFFRSHRIQRKLIMILPIQSLFSSWKMFTLSIIQLFLL